MKPDKHEQLYPRLVLVFIQVPLFWQGVSTSHGIIEILQLVPIDVDVGQVGATKDSDDFTSRKKWKIELNRKQIKISSFNALFTY